MMGPDGLQARAQVIGLPAGAMLSGPGYGLEDYTPQAMAANELLGGLRGGRGDHVPASGGAPHP
ncbi:hypothetical protein, partial [Arthrobacter sp. JCM 19049]|uniref:hypothetical protein n=1 Tax=Arthrobacter sp. JCM 19049 TaxID=1460643 RepID=UPI002436BAC9